jgi:hypothetical protein
MMNAPYVDEGAKMRQVGRIKMVLLDCENTA